MKVKKKQEHQDICKAAYVSIYSFITLYIASGIWKKKNGQSTTGSEWFCIL
jgi:hypothetical protein